MKILAIDIGLIHLALVCATLPDDYLTRKDDILKDEITFCDLIDITQLVSKCKDDDCELYHDKIICDYTMHLFKQYRTLFESVDKIIIERQPPFGFVSVQELIMREYRSKSELVSPNAMLKFFDLLHYTYDERKVYTEKIAMDYLGSNKIFIFNERRHDMADGVCLLIYYISNKRSIYRENMREEEFRTINKNFLHNIKQYILNND